MGSAEIDRELERVVGDFRELAAEASPADLARRSCGTRWTNQQLLFHMVFGYLLVRTLLPMVHLLGRLGWSRRFASTLNAACGPFHLINYLGSAGGGTVLRPVTMAALLERTVTALRRRLQTETTESLALQMHFPVAWDPYFRPTMSVLDVYHFATQHYDHHRSQLTLDQHEAA